MPRKTDFCCLCGNPRHPTQKPIESFGMHEVIFMRDHRVLKSDAPVEANPQMIVHVGLYRNGGGLPGEHICDSCIQVGLQTVKTFVDDTLAALTRSRQHG